MQLQICNNCCMSGQLIIQPPVQQFEHKLSPMESSFLNWVVASSCCSGLWLQTPCTISGRLSSCRGQQALRATPSLRQGSLHLRNSSASAHCIQNILCPRQVGTAHSIRATGCQHSPARQEMPKLAFWAAPALLLSSVAPMPPLLAGKTARFFCRFSSRLSFRSWTILSSRFLHGMMHQIPCLQDLTTCRSASHSPPGILCINSLLEVFPALPPPCCPHCCRLHKVLACRLGKAYR